MAIKRSPIKRSGKKTKEWDRVRAKLKIRFERAGITTCELGYEGCWRDNGLGFAHAVKRRFIATPEELEITILACWVCHDVIECKSHIEMRDIVENTISARQAQP